MSPEITYPQTDEARQMVRDLTDLIQGMLREFEMSTGCKVRGSCVSRTGALSKLQFDLLVDL